MWAKTLMRTLSKFSLWTALRIESGLTLQSEALVQPSSRSARSSGQHAAQSQNSARYQHTDVGSPAKVGGTYGTEMLLCGPPLLLAPPTSSDRDPKPVWLRSSIAAHTQLRLTRPLAVNLRRPGERPADPRRLTPARDFCGFPGKTVDRVETLTEQVRLNGTAAARCN